MIKLYQAEWCPWCHAVRQVLSELGLTYTTVNVPVEQPARKHVKKVSGQEGIPVLVDGDTVLTDSGAIVDYLRATYPPAADADDQAEVGAFRWLVEFDDAPTKVLRRVKQALAAEGFKVVAQMRGDKLSPRLRSTYVLLHVAIPTAVIEAIAADPTVAAAVTTPLVVFPVEGGTAVAITKPGAAAWLYGEPALLKITGMVAQRMLKVVEALIVEA
jgi:glutaredoxin 3